MSPDGTQYLWWYPGPGAFIGSTAVYISRLTVGQSVSDGLSFCGGSCVTSHGWVGQTPIAAFPADTAPGEPSQVCRLANEQEAPGASRSCVQVLVSDARGGIAFPSGNAAGTEIVAAMSPGEETGVAGRIVRYSLATGHPLADVTQGTTDTTPVFSAEGDRVAFERDDQIVIKDLADGSERAIGPGTYPFWGGPRTDADAGVSLGSKRLRYRRGKVKVKITCEAAEDCRGKLSIRTAKRVKVGDKGKRKAKRLTIAKDNYRVTAGDIDSEKVRPKGAGRRLLEQKRGGSIKVKVNLRPKGGGEKVAETLKLKTSKKKGGKDRLTVHATDGAAAEPVSSEQSSAR
ncbi:MAG: hypothetical protein GEU88_11410 [Solirubrobacterales bacterium]|nr:hypothetical protein [Solirubrobacterales bacterium]